MNYLHDKNYNFRQNKKLGWKKPFGLVFIAVGLFIWGEALFVDFSSFITYPFLKMSGRIEQNFSDSLRSRKILLAENQKIKLENQNLKSEILRLEEIETENDRLRQRENATTLDGNPVLAHIIAKPDHLLYDEIIIDTGRVEKPTLSVGQLIFADHNTVLGQIDSIADKYSKVKLYSTGGVKIPVVVGENAVPSIAEGLGGGNFSSTLPRGVNIQVGDQIRTSIVGDYVLGYVANVFKDSNDPFQKIIFRSPYNVFELEWVQF